MTQLGFEVVGGDDYERLWDAERTAVGGFFDPFTGKPDAAKLKASRQRVFGSMQEHLAATAIVLPRVVERVAQFSSGTAEWDGVKESLSDKSGLAKILSLDRTDKYAGGLGALSLEVRIIDPAGERLFEGFGGIQVVENFNPAGNERLADSERHASHRHCAGAPRCPCSYDAPLTGTVLDENTAVRLSINRSAGILWFRPV